MKKVLVSIMAIMLIAIFACSAMASTVPYFDVIDGQKVMIGDVNDIVIYLQGLTRQQMIDLAVVDRGEGQFYARVLPTQDIVTWTDGTQINAYGLSSDMFEYRIYQNGYFLVADENGEVTSVNTNSIESLDDENYPMMVYSAKDEALIESYILAECYPDIDATDVLSEDEGFENHEIFKALVLAYDYSERHQSWVYFLAWKVVEEEQLPEPVKPVAKPTAKPAAKPTPENNPRPTEPGTTPKPTPENNPRPTERVPSGDGEKSNDPDPLPTKKPENNGKGHESGENTSSNTGHGQVSNDPDPMNSGRKSESSSGTVSHDPDPMNSGRKSESSSGTSSTGSGSVSHDPDPMNSSRKSESSSSSSSSSVNSSSSSSSSSNSSKPSESSSSSRSSNSESTGSGSVSSDSDPFA